MAVDMFLKLGGLKGESADKSKKDWIDVLAWSWGASNSGTAHIGGGAGAGKVNVQDISFTKYVDTSSTELILATCNGKHFKDATLIVRKAGENPLEYLTITLESILVTSVSTGGSGGEDRLTENVTLNFAKIKIKYTEQTPTGAAGDQLMTGWDIAGNVKY